MRQSQTPGTCLGACLGAIAIAYTLAAPSGARGAAASPKHDAVISLGTLTCSLGGEPDTKSVGQGRNILCRFRPGPQGAEETYIGTVQGVGQIVRLFSRGIMMMAVKGPASTEVGPGMLEQSYEAEAAGSGAAAAPLVGGRNKAIVLQQLTEEEGRVESGKLQPDAVVILLELKLQTSTA